MGAVPVVVVIPITQRCLALAGVLVGKAIGPLTQRRLDEALRFPIGLRPVRPRKPMADAQLLARLREVLGPEGRTVIRQQLLDLHAQARVVAHGISQELHCLRRFLIGMHRRERDACVVINGDEQHFPASTADRVPAIARHAMGRALYAPELLGVDVQHFSWGIMLVTNDRLNWLQVYQARQTSERQHASYRAFGDAQGRSNTCLGQSFVAQLYDGQGFGRRYGSG